MSQAIEQNILGAALSVPGYATLMTLYGACQGANRQRPGAPSALPPPGPPPGLRPAPSTSP